MDRLNIFERLRPMIADSLAIDASEIALQSRLILSLIHSDAADD
jgi:hypothetical protein